MTLDAQARAELAELGVDPEALDPALLEQQQASDLEWLDAVRDAYPLAFYLLWTAPEQEWDQQRAAMLILTAPLLVLIKGGNRSGKTKLAITVLLVLALGREHPVSRAFCELNDIPLELIPSGPGTVVALAREHNDSVLYHRPVFDELLGAVPHRWLGKEADAPARLVISVPGTRKKARVLFKAVAQGRGAMQGFDARACWIDEEPLEPKGPGVVAELIMRVLEHRGRVVITYASLSGFTWMHERYEVQKRDRVRKAVLDALANPHLPTEEFAEHYAGLTEDEVAQRRFGEARVRTGLIYHFEPGDYSRYGPGHVVDADAMGPPPPGAMRFRAADFGLDLPNCMLWAWWSPEDDGTLYVYREYYKAGGPSYEAHADACALMEGWVSQETPSGEVLWVPGPDGVEPVEAGWGDPSQPQAIAAYGHRGLHMGLPPFREVRPGIDAVRNRLRRRADGRPRLKVYSCCRNLIRELGLYQWDPNRKDEAPLKLNDHAPDALRYLVVGVERYLVI